MGDVAQYDRPFDEPPPKDSEHPGIQLMILDDLARDFNAKWLHDAIAERAEFGKQKYGQYLKPFDGRSTKNDLMGELLDALVYARKGAEEVSGSDFNHPDKDELGRHYWDLYHHMLRLIRTLNEVPDHIEQKPETGK